MAKESNFSGLNNLAVNSISDSRYSKYFGFTPEEVKEIAHYYHAAEKYGGKSALGMTGTVLEIRKYLIHGLSSIILEIIANLKLSGSRPAVTRLSVRFWRMRGRMFMSVSMLYCKGNLF